MCGRYFLDVNQEEIKEMFDKVMQNTNTEVKSGEIFPIDIVPVVINYNSNIKLVSMKWGYPGIEGKGSIINAKSETLLEKEMFRVSWKYQRCVVISSHFFEWRSEEGRNKKVKYAFHTDENLTYMAGIYKKIKDQYHIVIITREANETMSDYHHRMPLILKKAEVRDWLMSEEKAKVLLYLASAKLVVEDIEELVKS